MSVKPRVGDRVRITGPLADEPNPIPVGTEGTVTWVGQWTADLTSQVGVDWDNGSKLLLLRSDPYVIVS